MISRFVSLILLFIIIQSIFGQQKFQRPNRQSCLQRKIHYSNFGKNYHFSWRSLGRNVKFSWNEARNYCRRFCMDSISFESKNEYLNIKEVIRQENIPYIWTGGRKCNFKGCGRVDLQPAIYNGWFWANKGTRIPPPNQCDICDWSPKGGLNQPQPDNREFRTVLNGEEEACIAILNNVYKDDIKWHDVGCKHRKPIICQDEKPLLQYVNLE